MIKLFRNIRRNLLETGKTSKYLKYAIGEIVLVVIGILIALSINNWNENNKKQQKVEELLKQVNLELAYNIKGAEGTISYYIIKDSLAHRMLNVTLKKGEFDPIRDKKQFNIMFNSSIFIPEKEAFKNFIQNNNDLRPELELIARKLKKINIMIYNNMLVSSEKMNSISNTYRNHLVYNSDWFSSFYNGGQINQQVVNHILKDPVFKNNLVYYRTAMTFNYSNKIRRYVHQARMIHKTIKEVLGDTTSYDFEYKHLPLELLQNYEGSYVSDEHGKLIQFEIVLKDDMPYLIINDNPLLMRFTNNNTYYINTIKYQILNDGSIIRRVARNKRHELRTFKKIK